MYKITCNKCEATYIGETSRNANSRGKEHKNDYDNDRDNSIMLRHTQLHHRHDVNKPEYTMTVKQIYGNKCMDRQIAEAIQINNIPNLDRINTKIDYKQHRLPRASLTWE